MPLLSFAHMSQPGEAARFYSGERLVNYFARPVSNGVSPIALIARAGLAEHVRLGTGPVRAATAMGGAIYAVCDGKVMKVSGNTATQVGSVPDGETYMAASINEVAIVSGGRYFLCDGTSLTEYSTGAVTTPHAVAQMDGYFIVIGADANRGDVHTISGLDDGTTFNGLEFGYAENNVDPLVGVFVDHNEVLMFGTDTVQVFYNSGNSDYPLEPNKGATVQHGCLNGKTIAAADSGVFWVRPDGAVLRYAGGAPQVISTPEVKEALEGSTVTGGLTFTDEGAEFYGITRTGKTTLCYDLSTGLWAERSSGLDYAAWQALNRVTVSGTEYLGCSDGRIATQSRDLQTDFDGLMVSEATSIPVENGGEFLSVSKLHLNVGGGKDLTTTPQVMLQTSKDGQIWGGEKWRPLGGQGDYWKRATWHGLGAFRRFQARIRITDAVPRDVYGVNYVASAAA